MIMKKLFLFTATFSLLLGACSMKIESPAVSETGTTTVSAQSESPAADTKATPAADTKEPSAANAKETPAANVKNPSVSKPIKAVGTKLEYKNPHIPFTPISITVSGQNQAGLKPDLSNIVNISRFTNLTQNQKDFLAKNHFVVTPSNNEQLFYVYEQNEYTAIPSFITTDSILQLYHVFYDYSLRTTEETALTPSVQTLTSAMLAELISEYKTVSDKDLKQAVSDCIAYFAVAENLLGQPLPDGIPDSARDKIDAEVSLANAAAGVADSPLIGGKVDYSAFTVRGHYTRTGDFQRYFKAMMWYGYMYFNIYKEKTPDVAGTQRAMIIANAASAANMLDTWESVYSPTAFYVGQADDLTIYDIYNAMSGAYTGDFWAWLSDTNEVAKISETLADLNKAQIQQQYQKDAKVTQFRFMGQRYTPDSDILQSLTDTRKRPYPSALDVAAVLGSADAAGYIAKYLNPAAKWPEYNDMFTQTKSRFDALPDDTWRSNMYYGWLWSLKPLFNPVKKADNYPLFTQTQAWRDKSLATALASWTELRHDTVLYVKESGAEMGGWPETKYPGYVEPSIEVYERLLWLTNFSKENLSSRGLLNDNMSEKADKIASLLEFLITCSQKELNGEPLTEDEQSQIVRYGGVLESLSVSIATDDQAYEWYQVMPDADRNMALAVDVHSGADGVLTEAIGTAAEIYVITESQGQLILTRGAVFDYFEQITANRLTDEAWQSMIANGQIPGRPDWTSSFLETTGIGNEPPAPSYDDNSGDGTGDYVISDSDTRVLQESELMNLTPLQLKIARNEIYARHGRKFNDQMLQDYFNQKPWYSPSIDADKFSEDMLNAVEKQNVQIIAKIEKMVSGS